MFLGRKSQGSCAVVGFCDNSLRHPLPDVLMLQYLFLLKKSIILFLWCRDLVYKLSTLTLNCQTWQGVFLLLCSNTK
jgi:hypothetical protein